MSINTVKQLAIATNIPLEQLLVKLEKAEISISSPEQVLSVSERQKLLTYLRQKPKEQTILLSEETNLRTEQVVQRRRNVSTLRIRGASNPVMITRNLKKAYITTSPLETKTISEPSVVGAASTAEVSALDLPQGEITGSLEPMLPQIASKEDNIGPPSGKKKLDTYKAEEKRDKKYKNQKESKHRHTTLDLLQDPVKVFSKGLTHRKGTKPKGSKIETLLKQEFEKPVVQASREVLIPEMITVSELAQKMSVKASEVIKQLMKLGVCATINQPIDQDTAIMLVEETGHIAKPLEIHPLEADLKSTQQIDRGGFVSRPPVVTVMGHVDHGKTSLLDYIRRTRVASKESGGITQHIGAYHVEIPKGTITFLDTPGHAAFTAMRARGARLTDIVVLIVAADDGVMPQTVEAIQHAQAAVVPIVVVINKIDKPGADIDRVQQALSQYQLVPEAWGGDILFVPVSAKTGEGVDAFLDALLVQAEILELKAEIAGPAQGIIIDSRLEKGLGPVATILVQRGTLRKGDILLAGTSFGKIRVLHDEKGKAVQAATPSLPVEIIGLSTLPVAGDEAWVVESERKAREIALYRSTAARNTRLKPQRVMVEDLMEQQRDEEGRKYLNIILKTDVQGSVEALHESLTRLSTTEVQVRLLISHVGAITESDVNLSLVSKALILGFNVRADHLARQVAERENVSIHYHTVIYELLDQVKGMMSGLLAPLVKETILGVAIVREVFRATKMGTVAGCQVTEGTLKRGQNLHLRILRNHVVVHQGELHSLRRFKEDVSEVRVGTECGISIKHYTDIQIGDVVELYERVTVTRTL